MRGVDAQLLGTRYGKLVVVSHVRTQKNGKVWQCKCDCGGTTEKLTSQLTRSQKHFGCAGCEKATRSIASSLRKHGECALGKPRLYKIWKGMRRRCYTTTDTSYPFYGAKGIKVCDAWQDYTAFKQWAMSSGYADTLTINRIDPRGDYTPDNCEWITKSENSKRAHAAQFKEKAVAA